MKKQTALFVLYISIINNSIVLCHSSSSTSSLLSTATYSNQQHYFISYIIIIKNIIVLVTCVGMDGQIMKNIYDILMAIKENNQLHIVLFGEDGLASRNKYR